MFCPETSGAFFEPSELGGVRVRWLHESRQALSFYNDSYCFVAVHRSPAEIMFRGRRFEGGRDLVALMEPDGVFRHLSLRGPETIQSLMIPAGMVDRARFELSMRRRKPIAEVVLRAPESFDLLRRTHDALARATSPVLRQSLLVEVVHRWLAHEQGETASPNAGEHRAARRARDYLHVHFRLRLTLVEIARAAGISVFHLVRTFTRSFGMPPHAYQTHLRLAHSFDLLARGLSVSECAAAAGFVDQSHLTRHFRRAYGLTPGALGRQLRGRRVFAEAVPG